MYLSIIHYTYYVPKFNFYNLDIFIKFIMVKTNFNVIAMQQNLSKIEYLKR